ncbi:MAG: phage tail protein [Negativicutes bacterium]|nr:phage tail protein [Negativicutes bacterium]
MSNIHTDLSLVYVDSTPIGTIIAFPATTIPNGYLECNGQAISRTTYAELFALLATTYGAGDGLTTYNLPDYRGVFLRHKDNGKGYDAGRQMGTFQEQDVMPHTHTIAGGAYGISLSGGNVNNYHPAGSGLSTNTPAASKPVQKTFLSFTASRPKIPMSRASPPSRHTPLCRI